jgi:putative DNA primase/helicase
MALWLVANDRPKGRVDDDALWRRLVPIEFDQVFAEGQRDGRLTEKLTRPQERIGVLTWIVENAMKYLDLKKLELPARCREGIESYKRHSNPVQSWIEEKLVLDPLGRVQTSAAWDDYRAWCNANEERSVRKGNFREILDSLFERGRINGYDNWHGVRRVEEYQQPANFE